MISVIVLLVLLIVAHEFGHFITAKLKGVLVEEFGLGFPPRIVSVRRGETIYSLNLLPLGGFVRMVGEEDPSHPRSLAAQSLPTRLLVIGAGSLMNILLPIVLFTASFMLPKEVVTGPVIIQQVAPGSPAERAGLLVGDRVLEANGRALNNSGDLLYQIQLNLGSPMPLLVERDGATRTIEVAPRWKPPPGQGPLGVQVKTENPTPRRVSSASWRALPQGLQTLWDTLRLFGNEVRGWLIRRVAPQVGGPVAIVQMAGEVAQGGPGPLLAFTAFLSINLAIINLLPIPGLDGGRLAFLFLEAVRGKKVSPKRERLVHLVGFVILLGLIILVTYNDVIRLTGPEGP